MEYEEIAEGMKKALNENLQIDLSNVDMDQNLIDMGLNSLQYVQMLVLFEGEFDIEFEEEYLNINTLNTFNKIKAYIYDKKN